MQTTELLAVDTRYQEDHLLDGCECQTLHHPYDYEGKVISTLIRKKSAVQTDLAVLYVHGFNDYFFQSEMASWWTEQGWGFYATDLRKYGRSWRPHQKMNNVRNLREYYHDLDKALEHIEAEGHRFVVLCGHSTGGLIAALYMHDHPNHKLVNALFLNSPFFDFNMNPITKAVGIPLISRLGKRWPDVRIKGGFSKYYGHSLHCSENGEWEYDLKWKPHVAPAVNFGFIRAIHQGHRRVRRGLKLDVPTLVMHSGQSYNGRGWSEKYFSADTILNVRDIRKGAERIDGDVRIESIPEGMHDLMLSRKKARNVVYEFLGDWVASLETVQAKNREI